jgi:hypothetical protein
MDNVQIRFVVSRITEDEVVALKQGQTIISKMILSLDDYKLFRYQQGDKIEVETSQGNRLWCNIQHLETVPHPERMILIFTLKQA